MVKYEKQHYELDMANTGENHTRSQQEHALSEQHLGHNSTLYHEQSKDRPKTVLQSRMTNSPVIALSYAHTRASAACPREKYEWVSPQVWERSAVREKKCRWVCRRAAAAQPPVQRRAAVPSRQGTSPRSAGGRGLYPQIPAERWSFYDIYHRVLTAPDSIQ
ncbi:hypothetical protein WMY93_013613 [Mugilogobius chulae]|uniref:Uncharacterized protein n=1 Tax=Mugilogobius chulae TaxID=88201 RepID=A0AAW0PAK4_9GOBI